MPDLISPSSAQWPEPNTAAIAPTDLYPVRISAGLYVLSTDADPQVRFSAFADGSFVIEDDTTPVSPGFTPPSTNTNPVSSILLGEKVHEFFDTPAP